ncbi:MBL fold metallo-hydrolase [Sutcliffiella halmapala]|uniref:MBL fold metallo-hydrolase n=1 Tax=Sutcliffiella halmapala TaxID=79882 RepID=UPI0009951814|nr:MBL fold metallo-hydrolase [Sutcliffiella halmapala]
MIEFKTHASSSKGNLYTVTDGKTKLMIECGLSYKEIQRALNFKISEIEGCLLSHNHGDHARGVKDIMKAGIDVYTSLGTMNALKVASHRFKEIKALEQFRIGTWTILPFDIQHDTEDPLGFLLANEDDEKLLFVTDTYYVKYKFEGVNILAVECNYSMEILNQNILEGFVPAVMKKRLIRSHFSLENVKEFLKANDLSKVQEIWLLHLSDSNSNAELFKEEIMALTGRRVYVP